MTSEALCLVLGFQVEERHQLTGGRPWRWLWAAASNMWREAVKTGFVQSLRSEALGERSRYLSDSAWRCIWTEQDVMVTS